MITKHHYHTGRHRQYAAHRQPERIPHRNTKEYMQSALVKLEDVDAAYRLLLSIDKEFAEEVGKKYADDLREAFRKGREQERKIINGK